MAGCLLIRCGEGEVEVGEKRTSWGEIDAGAVRKLFFEYGDGEIKDWWVEEYRRGVVVVRRSFIMMMVVIVMIVSMRRNNWREEKGKKRWRALLSRRTKTPRQKTRKQNAWREGKREGDLAGEDEQGDDEQEISPAGDHEIEMVQAQAYAEGGEVLQALPDRADHDV
jgi:hypothetical protein